MIKFVPAKYSAIAFATIMSFVMSGVISATFILINHHFDIGSLSKLPMSWLKAWLVALPVAILIVPSVRKLVASITI